MAILRKALKGKAVGEQSGGTATARDPQMMAFRRAARSVGVTGSLASYGRNPPLGETPPVIIPPITTHLPPDWRQDTVAIRYRLDPHALASKVAAQFGSTLAGYALAANSAVGRVILHSTAGHSHKLADGLLPWTATMPQHVASVSKWVTIHVLARLLARRGIALTAPIAPYLPGHWHFGPGISTIRFIDLISHKSGLTRYAPDGSLVAKGPGYCTVEAARIAVANGRNNPADEYQNQNITLCRMLFPVLIDQIEPDTPLPLPHRKWDAVWDALATQCLRQQAKALLFGVAKVRDRPFATSAGALAYRDATDPRPGLDCGDLTLCAGTVGWRFSALELLRLAHEIRQGGTQADRDRVRNLLANGISCDPNLVFGVPDATTPAAYILAKGGVWGEGELEGVAPRRQIAGIYMLPDGGNVAFLANSTFLMPPADNIWQVGVAIQQSMVAD